MLLQRLRNLCQHFSLIVFNYTLSLNTIFHIVAVCIHDEWMNKSAAQKHGDPLGFMKLFR